MKYTNDILIIFISVKKNIFLTLFMIALTIVFQFGFYARADSSVIEIKIENIHQNPSNVEGIEFTASTESQEFGSPSTLSDGGMVCTHMTNDNPNPATYLTLYFKDLKTGYYSDLRKDFYFPTFNECISHINSIKVLFFQKGFAKIRVNTLNGMVQGTTVVLQEKVQKLQLIVKQSFVNNAAAREKDYGDTDYKALSFTAIDQNGKIHAGGITCSDDASYLTFYAGPSNHTERIDVWFKSTRICEKLKDKIDMACEKHSFQFEIDLKAKDISY